jgi:hypothetical protein
VAAATRRALAERLSPYAATHGEPPTWS